MILLVLLLRVIVAVVATTTTTTGATAAAASPRMMAHHHADRHRRVFASLSSSSFLRWTRTRGKRPNNGGRPGNVSSSLDADGAVVAVPAPARIIWEERMEETMNDEEEEDLVEWQNACSSSTTTPTTTLRKRMKSFLGIPDKKTKSKNDDDDDDNSYVSEDPPEPHPLRTRLWEFQVHWRGPAKPKKTPQQQQQQQQSWSSLYDCTKLVLEFDPSGYVRVQQPFAANRNNNNNDPWIATGTWSVEATGVSCSIPISVAVSSSSSSSSQQPVLLLHRFEADLHLNPFGNYAKLTRGVILRDRPHRRVGQRRDVLGTFSGRGTGGPDTVDLSYATRRRRQA